MIVHILERNHSHVHFVRKDFSEKEPHLDMSICILETSNSYSKPNQDIFPKYNNNSLILIADKSKSKSKSQE